MCILTLNVLCVFVLDRSRVMWNGILLILQVMLIASVGTGELVISLDYDA